MKDDVCTVGLKCFGYRGFPVPGFQVLFPDGQWKSAVVLREWGEVEVPSGLRSQSYDVQGFDDQGFFHGRFDSQHVRSI